MYRYPPLHIGQELFVCFQARDERLRTAQIAYVCDYFFDDGNHFDDRRKGWVFLVKFTIDGKEYDHREVFERQINFAAKSDFNGQSLYCVSMHGGRNSISKNKIESAGR